MGKKVGNNDQTQVTGCARMNGCTFVMLNRLEVSQVQMKFSSAPGSGGYTKPLVLMLESPNVSFFENDAKTLKNTLFALAIRHIYCKHEKQIGS